MVSTLPTFTAEFLQRNPVQDILLARFCTMRIGGAAALVTLEDRRDLRELLASPVRWLGKGANLLIGDGAAAETVVRLGEQFSHLELGTVQGGVAVVRAGAGLDLAKLMAATTAAGLAGPEGLAGVPATVGGALRMNAGTTTCWMLDWVSRVEVVLPGEEFPRWLERAAIPAGYRDCGLPQGTVFLGCEMQLAAADPAVLQANARRLKQTKAASQPLAARSAGCVFRNPSRECPAGKLIDELGLKGSRIGAAMVSPVHANFIVNDGEATAADVTALIQRIRHTAWRERGIILQLEVETWNIDAIVHAHPEVAGEQP